MKVVVAIDSFKGSMTSMQAGNACKKGILAATKADVVVKPLADGGEGTVQRWLKVWMEDMKRSMLPDRWDKKCVQYTEY